MHKTKYIEVEANTVKQAIEKALKILGVKRKEVEIKILSEGERGLFEMGGAKLAKIRATAKTTRHGKS